MIAARPGDTTWFTLHEALPLDRQPKWSINRGGELIAVPLFPYHLKESTGETLVQFGAQVGAALSQLLPPPHRARRMFIAVGNVFQRQDAPGYEVWLGVAVEPE